MENKDTRTVKDLLEILPVKLETGSQTLNNVAKGIYCGDLLSWVMAKAKKGNVWITIQSHINVVAVASLVEIPAVIIAEDSTVSEEVIKKADEEGVAILTTSKTAYEIASLCGQNKI
ncbi:MAG: AraC family transcriptional regulator [Epulopiscium sp.]|nr:AraC family transcriptional regulator [Candidatus Epulonipiscium sp.]